MSEIKRVKINHLLNSQIPDFLNEESPLFREFLNQYYISQEHQTGIVDLSTNIQKYKKIENFNNDNLIDLQNPSTLSSNILSFDDTIFASHTIGYPNSYGLIKINNEIITYTGITTNSFTGCIRGFSGIDNLNQENNIGFLNFSTTEASEHSKGTTLNNLSFIFFFEIFKKFKSQFLPGFEDRNFTSGISIQNILSRAKDFYTSKGTDQSYKILFAILYGKEIEVISPQDYMLRPSDNNYFITKNILVEQITGNDPTVLNGSILNQFISGIGTISASIYNVEYRQIFNKNLYEISLDTTSFTGDFETTGSTRIIESIESNSNTITVDSTIGFAQSGAIIAQKSDLIKINLKYTDKTNNQFLNVTGLNASLSFGDFICENKLAYSYNNDSLFEFRIINLIDNIDTKRSSGLKVGDKISLSSFGKNLYDNVKFNSWIYNIPTYHNIVNISTISSGEYRIQLKDNIKFYKNDEIYIKDTTNIPATINFTESNNTIIVSSISGINTSNVSRIERKIKKAKSKGNYFSNILNINAGVQNTYIDKDEKFLYVTSSGIPNYEISSKDTKITVKTVGLGITTTLNVEKHNFLSGDKIYYDSKSSAGISTGIYFVKKIDNDNLSLSYSNTDLFSKKYISLNVGVTADFIYKSGYENKTIKDQRILKKFNLYENNNYFDNKNDRTTFNRQIGLLINGVELYSPTLFDENIYYGKVDSIIVTNPGKNYDVVNSPDIIISDSLGSGCKANLILSGSLEEVQINRPGIGYTKKPKITLIGGNGSGAVLESNLVKSKIISKFRSDLTAINTSTETITFTDNHNFVNYEEVIYFSNGNSSVPGLIDKSNYFVNITNPKTIKLHKNRSDVLSGINTVNITGISSGIHEFRTFEGKNTISKIYVKNKGSGYSNRLVKVPSVLYPTLDYQISGINTFDSYIFAKKHGFKNGDLIEYSHTNSPISGITTNTQYYITIIDENKFKLSEAGIGTTSTDLNYINKKYVNLNSLGIGTHTFAYPPISIKIETISGIGSTSIVLPILTPIVLGSAESVYLEDGGVSYGCSDIINFHRRPNANLLSISSALLKPIIINGSIVDIQIIFSGNGYDNGTKIIIYGDGKYADIKPIILNGKIVSFIIIDGGIGYKDSNTTLSAIRRGIDLQLFVDVFEWKINQIEKNKNLIAGNDETITYPNINKDFQLGIFNFYYPKQLKENIGDMNAEKHSPIIGWAYDGNPIYGPCGFSSFIGGELKLIKSSYSKLDPIPSNIRPNTEPLGFFIKDYRYNASGDLDQYNGRFCKTPEYPYGTYAYFATMSVEGVPEYPYIIGNFFKDTPIIENFNPNFNQNLDFKNLNLIRNFGNYFIDSANSGYEILEKVSSNLKQDFIVKQIKRSGITSIIIDSPGNDYKVNDVINFKKAKEGTGISAEISRVKGKSISNIIVGVKTFTNVVIATNKNNIIGITSLNHNLISGDKIVISGISTVSLSYLEGTQTILVNQKTTGLTTSLQSTSTTGLSTNITVRDTFGFEVNDSIGIGTEILTITNILPETSQLLVNRTSGGIHTAGIENVKLLSKKFKLVGIEPNPEIFPENEIVYFNPTNNVGFGTTGTNYSVFNVGLGINVNKFVPAKSIYIPNHNFYTGQKLIYSYSSGIGLSVSNNAASNPFSLSQNQIIYAVNYGNNHLGISTLGFTDSIGIGNTLNSLIFVYNSNVGYLHLIESTFSKITAKVENYSGIVSTTEPHDLIDGDKIKFTIIPSRTENVSFRYDTKNRKITTNLIGFSTNLVSIGNTSTINLESNNLKSGDKVIYYSGDSPIGGLIDKKIYYILKENPDKIQLCNYQYDVKVGSSITFSNVGVGTQKIALINPRLIFSKGNKIVFDISDSSLSGAKLEFYTDPKFNKKFQIDKKGSVIIETNNSLELQTNDRNIPSVLYYNFASKDNTKVELNQISTDEEVIGFNRIDILPSSLSNQYSIIGIGTSSFKFNLNEKPEYTEYTSSSGISSVFYDTDSKNTKGPISQVRINSKGKSYSILPSLRNIDSSFGNNAIVYPSSDEIGEILSFNRVKNGFDYPTDPTILPQLSVPVVCIVKEISRIDTIGILTGGKNYNVAPNLKVIGNDQIVLNAEIQGGSVINVKITKNVSDLKEPLRIVSTNNSNGYEIDVIQVNSGNVTIELVDDPVRFKPISIGYGSIISEFPFAIGDKIFIEKCRLTPSSSGLSNFNSKDYGYNFFTVTGINTQNRTLNYNMSELISFGTYNDDLTLGFVVNQKDIANFQMNIIDDAKYFSGEKVTSTNFSAKVLEDGWDNDINQLRLIDAQGVLNVGDKLYGQLSKLNGVVKYVNKFNLNASLGNTVEKLNDFGDKVGFLNDYQQKISDNFYYQRFSYSIKSEIPYSNWKESVKSIIHPSGFKEFSDLNIIGMPNIGPVNLGIAKSTNMKVSVASSEPSLLVNIDNTESLYTKHNFSMVYEEDILDDGSVERIFFPEGVVLRKYILNKTNKVSKIDDISSQFTGITSTIGGEIVGLSSFKIKISGEPAFYKQFVGSATTIISVENNIITIPNHGFQSGQEIIYNSSSGTKIGIATTSYALGNLNIIMEVGAGIGSAIYENGYNTFVPKTGIVTGISTTVSPGILSQYFGIGNPISGNVSVGGGVGALFQVLITYEAGVPIGTSIQLINGGGGYGVGQQISIAGTYMGGATPTNDLYFTISKVSSTRAGTINTTYVSVASTSSGIGTGAIFNVTRDANKDIESVTIVNGGTGYTSADQISIAGTYIGGATPADNLFLSPTLLGTDKLPTNIFVSKKNINEFRLCGISTSLSTPFDIVSLGSELQSFSFKNPNENTLISIDNIIQSPLNKKNITVGLSSIIGIGSTSIFISSGINSIFGSNILKINNELVKVVSVGIGSTNKLDVIRSFMGTVAVGHTIGETLTAYGGDYNIIDDVIYFSTPPYGPSIASTDPQFKISSSFAGRIFSRAFDSSMPNDINLILDDISNNFTGIAATQFVLKSNDNNIVGLFTNTNNSTDISNNPFILINNIFQVPEVDYTINTVGNNSIEFLSGVPSAGKIVRVAITTGFGYQPLIGAAATSSVSAAGTINSITLKGPGSGYRTIPSISIASTVGYGATISATIGVGGTISSLTIINGGIGYTSLSAIYVNIDPPLAYSNLGIAYTAGTSGVGTDAKVSVQVGSGSSIIQFNLENPGIGYKVGDILKVVGLTTNLTVGGGFDEFRITIEETLTDKFSGFYPGQLIHFDDFSQYFNDIRKKFTLTKTNNNITEVIDLKKNPGSDIILQNNLFVYLNDILQIPGESYTFSGSRIVFNEPPKQNSKCTVLFYRGSSIDVEIVIPPKTIKEGDIVQIGENIYDNLDREQFERVVKKIVASDQLDTYNYDSIGINTDVNKERPLKWTKQTQDRVILGSLVSKARPNLIATLNPATKIIKTIETTDTSIYVSNGYPLFVDIDLLEEAERNIKISENKNIITGLATAIVSTANTISSITISTGGIGYAATTSPKVVISSASVQTKDPIFNWQKTSGLSTSSSLISFVIGNPIVSVGQSGIVATTLTGTSISSITNIGFGGTITFNSVGLGSTNCYIAVGMQGKIVRATGFGVTLSSWTELDKQKKPIDANNITIEQITHNLEFKDVKYSSSLDKWIVVGVGGSIFSAVGINSNVFFLTRSGGNDLNSIETRKPNIVVVVGNTGTILTSSDCVDWNLLNVTGNNLNKIIWTGSQFISVGNNSEIRTSISGTNWEQITPNISANFTNIHYNEYYKLYTLLDSNGLLYYSYDLSNLIQRNTNQTNILKDINYSSINNKYISVGFGATSIYSDPVYNLSSAVSSTTSGIITSIVITNPGFGYNQNNPPEVLIETEKTKIEQIKSIQAKGDFGIIIGIDTSLSIGSTIPKLKFSLKSESYDNNTLGIGYSSLDTYNIRSSGISIGDYFIIYNSNLGCGHSLIGITTNNGYPPTVVGTSVTFIDGVYRAENVERTGNVSSVGIVTVTCEFNPNPTTGTGLNISNPGIVTNGYYGNYSWGKIYNYQNRSIDSPKQFTLNTNNGLVGLNTAPEVSRTRGLFQS
jgi:hypothetical protein